MLDNETVSVVIPKVVVAVVAISAKTFQNQENKLTPSINSIVRAVAFFLISNKRLLTLTAAKSGPFILELGVWRFVSCASELSILIS